VKFRVAENEAKVSARKGAKKRAKTA
jgi:hypothetical protein